MNEIPIGTLCRVVKPSELSLASVYDGRFCETVSRRVLHRFAYQLRPGRSRPRPAYVVLFPGSDDCVMMYEAALKPIVPPADVTDRAIQERAKHAEPTERVPFQYRLELPAHGRP